MMIDFFFFLIIPGSAYGSLSLATDQDSVVFERETYTVDNLVEELYWG